ncbi:MAG: CarD family transcriptional regulator [Alphaproteobacteria bacterium]|nr:CarD family transcriptional regulator [Alphaproteobacteria bacterium]
MRGGGLCFIAIEVRKIRTGPYSNRRRSRQKHRPALLRDERLRDQEPVALPRLSERDRAQMSTKKATAKPATPAKAPKAAAKASLKIEPKASAKPEAKKPELKAVPKIDLKVVPKMEAKPVQKVEPKLVAGVNVKPVAVAPVAVKIVPKPEKRKPDFRTNDWVVYPAHGVGRIISVVEQEVAGIKLELFVINFDKDKMTLRVPVAKATSIGMRRLSSPDVVATALQTLKGRARIKRTMWSRRAQEYEAKINSGDLISIAEVVRDLHRASGQPEQSYSERQLYEAALGRMAREVAAVERIDEDAAVKRLEVALQRAA